MPETDGQQLVPEGSRTLVALSERTAIVETKVSSLKEDTGIIRATLHAVNNEMQRFVAIEQRCAASLAELVILTRDLPTIAEHGRDFMNMRESLRAVIEERHERKGAWSAAATSGSIILGGITVGGAIFGTILWLSGHVH